MPNYKEGLSYLEYQRKQFIITRDFLIDAFSKNFSDLPIKPLECESGFFLMADISECKEIIPK
jgi:hypothetical protein